MIEQPRTIRSRLRAHVSATRVFRAGLLIVTVAVSGCFPSIRGVPGFPGIGAKPVFPSDIGKPELVSRLNENANLVESWIARDCSITVRMPKGIPARLKATIACEEPRSFRLVANGSLVVRTDVGSNDDQCWWWAQPGDNVMYYVRHCDMDYVRDHPVLRKSMSMPFEPEWLMQVLGVLPIDEHEVTLLQDRRPGYVNLVSEHPTPDGRMFRRVMVVDLHRGRIVAHRIVDSSNNTVARAMLTDYTKHNGVNLPSRIELDWPTMDTSLTIRIDGLNLNTKLQPNLWQPPQDKMMGHVDLGEHLRRMDAAGAAPGRTVLEPGRPDNRPLFDPQGVDVKGDGSEIERVNWDDGPAYSPKRSWFRWPFRRSH